VASPSPCCLLTLVVDFPSVPTCGAFSSLFLQLSLFAGAFLLKGFSTCVPVAGTFSSLKVVIVVGYYSLSFWTVVKCLHQPCLWSSPWQNCLPILMIEIKTLEV
jgi:hypothetical protein